MIKPIELDFLSAQYDPVKKMVFIVYRNALTPQVTVQAYNWLDEVFSAGLEVQGGVFDFQQVRRFEKSNLSSSQRESTDLNYKHDMSHIPVALLVSNAYQEQMVRSSLELTPQQDRKRIVNSYGEAFDFIREFRAAKGKPVTVSDDEMTMSTDEASVRYDREKDEIFITYYGTVTQRATADVYSKMIENVERVGVDNVRAGIFDFRHVMAFDNTNLRTVQRSSREMNTSYDMSHIAVALVVGSIHQERMVITALRVTPQEERKRLVFNFAEAQKFIEKFHAKRAAQANNDS